MRMRAKAALSLLPAVALVLLAPDVALAHEQRDVGPIHMEVGFGTEPTYVGQPNSVQLLLSTHGKPILRLGDSLKVTVSFGGQSTDQFPIEPNFEIGGDGTPGDYRAWFVPTQAGPYTFHFTGTVEGTRIDESFTGGPKTFSTVEDMSSVTFPQVAFPANNELATRIEQDASRTQTDIKAARAAANAAKTSASTARTIGIIGAVLGLVGTGFGLAGFSAGRKRG